MLAKPWWPWLRHRRERDAAQERRSQKKKARRAQASKLSFEDQDDE